VRLSPEAFPGGILKPLPERSKHRGRVSDLRGWNREVEGTESGALSLDHGLDQNPPVSGQAGQPGTAVVWIFDELHETSSPESVDENLDVLSGDRPRASHVGHRLRSDSVQVDQDAALAGHRGSVSMNLGGDRSELAEGQDHLFDQLLDPWDVPARRVHDN